MATASERLQTSSATNWCLFKPSLALAYDLKMDRSEDDAVAATHEGCALDPTAAVKNGRTPRAKGGPAARIYGRCAAAAAGAASSSPRVRSRSQCTTPDGGSRTIPANGHAAAQPVIDPSWLPMDRFSQRLFCSGPGTCSPTGTPIPSVVTSPTKQKCYNDGGVFGRGEGSTARRYYVIHPDWVSESLSIQKLSINQRKDSDENQCDRSQSVPPTVENERDIITWQSHK